VRRLFLSHIHLPDGFLPVWLWASGYVLTGLLVAILWRWGKVNADPRRFALVGTMGAIMIVMMVLEIPPFQYHFNLSVVAGIILGPQLAVLTAFVVNVILALIGHGGITVVGLNTLVFSTESIVGYYVFMLLLRPRLSVGKSAFAATMIALILGTTLAYGIIALGSPWIDRALQSAALRPGMEPPPGVSGAHLNLARLAVLMFGIGAIGWVAEALLSSAIITYLCRVMPGLIKVRD
jgi:cobalt/nickel transport system permease protein